MGLSDFIIINKMGLKFRKGIFLVVYKREKNRVLYLLLKRKLHWKGWEFPKGGIEKNESKIQAVKRELREETGLKAKRIADIKIKGKFLYPKIYKDRPGIKGMSWSLFACEVSSKKIKIDKREHSGYKWLDYNTAYKKLSFDDKKRCLRIVNDRFNK